MPPCKPEVCPNGTGSCSTKEAQPGLHVCLPALGDPEVRDRYLRALQTGDGSGLQELVAGSFAARAQIEQRGLSRILEDGLTIERPIVGKDGDGNLEVVANVTEAHPAAELVLKFGASLGHTAKEHLLTPASRGEDAGHRGLAALGELAAVRALQASLTGGDSA